MTRVWVVGYRFRVDSPTLRVCFQFVHLKHLELGVLIGYQAGRLKRTTRVWPLGYQVDRLKRTKWVWQLDYQVGRTTEVWQPDFQDGFQWKSLQRKKWAVASAYDQWSAPPSVARNVVMSLQSLLQGQHYQSLGILQPSHAMTWSYASHAPTRGLECWRVKLLLAGCCLPGGQQRWKCHHRR